jgi:glycosyltransferase Alg8
MVPATALHPTQKSMAFTIGIIGIWRYSWAGSHVVRAFLFRRIMFPRWRARADEAIAAAVAAGELPRLFVLITSYRMEPRVTYKVYRALFREAERYGTPVTIVAAVTDTAEMRLLRDLHESMELPPHIDLVLMRQAGTGKRDAMAEALRAIARRFPRPDDVVVLMDGDSLVQRNSFRRCAGFFRSMPDLGALTTDNFGITEGSNWVKEWYDLRYAHRHLLMCSMALSRQLLVLTGRFSMFRARVATHPDFIDLLQNDQIDHWRHGRFKFLTGDDKSTWFWTLKNGWRMLYLPDVKLGCFEKLPAPGFVDGTTKLMVRWFGNMLRSSGRAVDLGPRRTGFWTWLALVDQRLSMWTALCGPAFCLMSAFLRTPAYIIAYLVWVVTSRFIQAMILGGLRRRVSPYYPFLLIYTQLYGALLKIHMSFRVDQQSWTRQGLSSGKKSPLKLLYTRYLTALAGASFLMLMAIVAGVIPTPGVASMKSLWSQALIGEQKP